MMSFQPGFYYIPFSKFSAVRPYLCLYEAAQLYFAIIWGKFTGKATFSALWCECSLSQAKEDAARFHLPATAVDKPLPINEPEAIKILSASPSCHHRCQPAACSRNAAGLRHKSEVHVKEHDTNIEFLVEIKSALQQRAVATKAAVLRHLLPLGLTCPKTAWRGKEETACLRENIWGPYISWLL